MLIPIPDVLTPAEVADLRATLLAAEWIDGNATSGAGSALAKRNRQLAEDAPAARAAQATVSRALGASGAFLSAALPHTVFPPLFNRYAGGEAFGAHVDNAIRVHGPTGARLRTDLSATLFLSDPDRYDGGALQIEGPFGVVEHKLPAGHLLLYPASSLHRVTPVTHGERLASFFWVQSLVADDAGRALLFDLDQSVQALSAERGGGDAEVLRLTSVYHNLMRRWASI